MNTMVMNKAQCCSVEHACPGVGATERSAALWSPAAVVRWLMRLAVAAAVAAALGLLVALIAATPSAVEAIAVRPVTATVELPRVVIHGERLAPGTCPLPLDPGAPCPVPVN